MVVDMKTRPVMNKPLDLYSAAAALSPYRNSNCGKTKAPPKDPINPLDVSSTAAASVALKPLKNHGSERPDADTVGVAKTIMKSHHGGLPTYADTVNDSTAVIVKSHNDRPSAETNGVSIDEAIGFLNRLREKSKESVYTQFLGILAQYREGNCKPIDVSRKVTLLFHRNQNGEFVEEMYKWTPWEHRFYMPFASATRAY